MKLTIIDANIFIDLTRIQMLAWIFKIGFEVYTTQEIIDQLSEDQILSLKDFIESKQLIVYLLSENEFEEVVNLTPARSLEFADKSVLWLTIHLKAIAISGTGPLKQFCQSKQLEVRDLIWIFDLLIEKKLLMHDFVAQKIEQLIKMNGRLIYFITPL
ncbi:MAG TPA: hypothetical protein VK772_11540 [Puia sp.]|nr:hypothetical protein [Puia sp.]